MLNRDELRQLANDAVDSAISSEGRSTAHVAIKRRIMRFLDDLPPDITVGEVIEALGQFTPDDPVDEYAKALPDDEESRRLFKP